MRRAGYLLLVVLLAFPGWTIAETIRWSEDRHGCTFSADDDGKYRYGLWKNNVGIVIAVDADEVRKANLRVEPLFAVFLIVRYRGKDSLTISPSEISLEFVKHYNTRQPAIDPDAFALKLQSQDDALAEKVRREIENHPEKAAKQQSLLQTHEHTVTQTREFLISRSLRRGQVTADSPEVNGWVFFSAKSKWLGGWEKQEKFVLRIPAAGDVFEFPFALPPSSGDLLLRRRAHE